MPSFPVNDIDVLIIDQMGKDISGVGIDPNIIGRIKIAGQKEPEKPEIKAIVLLDLTDSFSWKCNWHRLIRCNYKKII